MNFTLNFKNFFCVINFINFINFMNFNNFDAHAYPATRNSELSLIY